jgi:hypothetical protein
VTFRRVFHGNFSDVWEECTAFIFRVEEQTKQATGKKQALSILADLLAWLTL